MSLYLAIDGPDGCGKSTQARSLVEALRSAGIEVSHLREPGSTALGERLRALLLDPGTGELHPLSEALLFSAARQEMLRCEVEPALAEEKVVVVERCCLSTLIYQGHARGSQQDGQVMHLLRQLCERVHANCRPDLVFVLNLPFETSAGRLARDQRKDRIEGQGEEFLRRVHASFAELLELEPWLRSFLGELVCLDATVPEKDLAAAILQHTLQRLQATRGGADAHWSG